MTGFQSNLWAPWRSEYIEQLANGDDDCFLCRYVAAPEADDAQLVIWRTPATLVLLNRFPYTGGHLLVTPTRHVPSLDQMSDAEHLEIAQRVRDATRVLAMACNAQGFNIGMNLGACAGAGLPGHLHWHVVPRWAGDTNFMSIVGDVRVIPHWLNTLRDRIRKAAEELGIR